MKLTRHEKSVIRQFKRLETIWPETLWLFSGDGKLTVMKTGDNGERVMTELGGVDPDYAVEIIDIPNDGGGW